jgi:hypothetical protein
LLRAPRGAGARNICVGFADVTRIRRESGAAYVTHMFMPAAHYMYATGLQLDATMSIELQANGRVASQLHSVRPALRAKFAYDVRHVHL